MFDVALGGDQVIFMGFVGPVDPDKDCVGLGQAGVFGIVCGLPGSGFSFHR